MKIISHRGYWIDESEKNHVTAFERSFSSGYGVETDVRDFGLNLLISHDIPLGNETTLENFLAIANRYDSKGDYPIALNIKADGLAKSVSNLIELYPQLDCFVFDMAIPDMRSYFELNIPVFTRVSEVEKTPAWIHKSKGIWLDSFESDWFSSKEIYDLVKKDFRVCVVSSELHSRSCENLWKKLKSLAGEENLILCTDFPDDAKHYFF